MLVSVGRAPDAEPHLKFLVFWKYKWNERGKQRPGVSGNMVTVPHYTSHVKSVLTLVLRSWSFGREKSSK